MAVPRRYIAQLAASLVAVLFFLPQLLMAPCFAASREEALKGPVIKAGQRALETGDARPALIWVRSEDEDQIRQAFTDTMSARKSGMDARRVAETYFLETLVRLHVRSQGRPYNGINDIQPENQVVLAADAALESGSEKALCAEMGQIVSNGITRRFNDTLIKRNHMENSVEAGREYVSAYLDYVRYLEAVSAAASGGSE